MNAVQRLFTVHLLFDIFLEEHTVAGSRNSSSVEDSGSLIESGTSFPPEAIQADDNEFSGPNCDGKTCLRMCCPLGYAASENGCVEDQFTSDYPLYEKFEAAGIDLRLFVDDPCRLSRLGTPSMKKYLSFPLDVTDDTDFSESCVLRVVNSTDFLFGMCYWITICELFPVTASRGWYDEFRDIVTILCPLATLIVYSVVSELKNFQGLLIRCLMGSTLCIEVSFLMIQRSSTRNQVLILVSGTIVVYSVYVYLFWMMVMNFDIWRKFRLVHSPFFSEVPEPPKLAFHLRKNQCNHLTTKEYEKTKFVRYSLFAWGGPLIPTSLFSGCLIWVCAVDGWNDPKRRLMLLAMVGLFVLSCLICVIFYIFMFIATSLSIKRQMNEIARAINDLEKHHRDSKQWINLYLRLFILMGCYQILVIGLSFWDSEICDTILTTFEWLHSVMILLLLVWKDSVKRSFRNQVNIMLRKFNASRRPDAIPVIANEMDHRDRTVPIGTSDT